MRGFSPKQLDFIGFTYLMNLLDPGNCYGRERKLHLDWYSRDEYHDLAQQVQWLTDFIEIQTTYPLLIVELKAILARFKEIRGIIKKIENSIQFLDETELFEIKNFAIDMEKLIKIAGQMNLNLDHVTPYSTREIIKTLNPEDQVTRTFSISSRYSPQLETVRKAKQKIEKEIAESNDNQPALFVKRDEIIEREKKEEHRIKQNLTRRMADFLEECKKNIQFIAEVDFLAAKSDLAIRCRCRKPEFVDANTIEATGLIHPYVEKCLLSNGKRFIPVSFTLKQGANVLTGANMGGKTVGLAALTLNILLAHCGFYIFGDRLQLPALDFIFYLSEDHQSIQQGLSSFGAEVKEICSVIERMRLGTGFCAIDEFAKGTNPEEGERLVRAFLRLAENHGSFCILSTHFSGVVMQGMNHFQVVGLKNINLQDYSALREGKSFDLLQELMDYSIEKVEWDNPPPKDAVRVAALLGIQDEFLELVKEDYQERNGNQ